MEFQWRERYRQVLWDLDEELRLQRRRRNVSSTSMVYSFSHGLSSRQISKSPVVEIPASGPRENLLQERQENGKTLSMPADAPSLVAREDTSPFMADVEASSVTARTATDDQELLSREAHSIDARVADSDMPHVISAMSFTHLDRAAQRIEETPEPEAEPRQDYSDLKSPPESNAEMKRTWEMMQALHQKIEGIRVVLDNRQHTALSDS